MSTPDIAPTVVLVHGAFVDASSWNGVIAELNAATTCPKRRRPTSCTRSKRPTA